MSRKLAISNFKRALGLTAVLGTVLAWCWVWPRFLFLQSDTFWLIESGRYILEQHQLPAHEIYSFTRSGQPWIVYQWLFETILAGLFNCGGWLAVSLLPMISLSSLLFVGMWTQMIRRGANPLMAVLWLGLALAAIMPDVVSIRPQLVTFALLWLVQSLLERCWRQRAAGNFLWWLVLIAVIWTNVHISFVIEILAVSIYLACALKWRPGIARPLLWVLSGCIVVTWLNPYGFGLYSFVLHSWQDQNITPELRPLNLVHNVPLVSYGALALLLSVVGYRKISPPSLLLSGVFLTAGLSGARFILYFVFWTIPLVAEALSTVTSRIATVPWLSKLSLQMRGAVLGRLYPALLVVGVTLITAVQPVVFPSTIPVQAAEYLAGHEPHGPLFCGEQAGSYLIYRFDGRLPVFIDTRADVYGRQFCQRFRRAMLYAQGWEDLMKEYGIRLALVPNRYKLQEALAHSGSWRIEYQDSAYTIFYNIEELNQDRTR